MERARVVDSHIHFWDPATLHYPWHNDVPAMQRAFLPGDYAPLVTGDVDAVMVVEANCLAAESEAEVRFIDDLAKIDPRIVAIVAFVDLFDENNLECALARLQQYDRVVGVRQNIQGHEPDFCTDDIFVRGVERVGQAGLCFDLCATSDQLADVARLVERCSGTQFVLDHCGKPAIREDAFDSWARDLAAIAAHDNVACKLSGLLTETRADQRGTNALHAYAEHALACFGVSRLLYGSDWPVVTLAGGVAAWRSFTDAFTAGWHPADRQRFYADNAIRLYGVELHAPS